MQHEIFRITMFESSDYLFNEFTPSLRISEADDLMFSADTNSYQNTISSAVEQIITVDNATNAVLDTEKIFNSNTFSTEVTNQAVADLLVIPTESLLTFEPTLLLDDNTVNQFLLPAQQTVIDQQVSSNDVPDLLALQSCAICHEIFATEADLLDHMVGLHVSESTSTVPDDMSLLADFVLPESNAQDTDSTVAPSSGLENDWLLCDLCGRVLATALETPPIDLICCIDEEGKCNIQRQTLDTMYVCGVCSGLFGDANAMDRHKQTCDSINTATDTSQVAEKDLTDALSSICFTCDLCNDQFLTAEDAKLHAEACGQSQPVHERQGRQYKNSSSKMWNCGSCNQLFVTARELYRHKRGEDRPEGAPYTAYVCEECDKVLGSMCALHTHRKMHKVTKPGYPCRICGRRFNQSGHLAIHMRMHTGERPYPCDLCPKAFKVKVERDDHRRTHTGERPFACTACPKTFTAAARLREHARIHTDQRPYTCDICGAAFRRPYARTVHTLIHTGQKPHQCDICKTAFRRSGDMWKHKRTIHGIESVDEKRP